MNSSFGRRALLASAAGAVGAAATGPSVTAATTDEVVTTKLTKDFAFYHPAHRAVLTGTFVPSSDTVVAHSEVSGQMVGNAWGPLWLDTGIPPTPGGALVADHVGAPALPDVQEHQRQLVGRLLQEYMAQISHTERITGLTPGTRYTWALHIAVTGASDHKALAATPAKCAITPDDQFVVATCVDHRLAILRIGGRPFGPITDQPGLMSEPEYVDLGAKDPQGIAIDGKGLACVACRGSNAVALVDIAAKEVGPILAVASGPMWVTARTADSGATRFYVTGAAGRVTFVDVPASRDPTAVTTSTGQPDLSAHGATGRACLTADGGHLCIPAADGHLAVADPDSGELQRLTSVGETAIACAPTASADQVVVGTGGPVAVRDVTVSTGAVRATVPVAGEVHDLVTDASGEMWWCGNGTTYWYGYTDPLDWYDKPDFHDTSPLGIALTSDEYILAAMSNGQIYEWPGATVHIRPTYDIFLCEFALVSFTGAGA